MYIASKEEFLKNNPCNPYSLLARMKSDCEYVIGACGCSMESYKYLWALNPLKQITYMRYLWESLEEKPEWLTMAKINEYAERLGVCA